MIQRIPVAAATEIDLEAILMTIRAALLMQVRWVEDNVKPGDPLEKYHASQRRSNLEIVRQIEHELGLKPKKRKVLRRRLS